MPLESLGNCRLAFKCPGCGDTHVVAVGVGEGARWGWNGSMERPTFSPSILVRTGHFVPAHQSGRCWCTYNPENPDKPAPFKCGICHSFVTDGRIQFLGDCTHALAGKTVPLFLSAADA